MAKKKSGAVAAPTKAAAKAAKKAKAAQKVEKKEKKKVSKGKSKAEDSDDDLEKVLDEMRQQWEAKHTVTEELVEGPPSRRANATLTPCPSGNYLWCIGGEFFSEDGKAYFYNDVFRYGPDKDEWRKFVSPTCPGPRSAHAVVATPSGGGKLFLFGGEFSSLHQNSFHHYRDFWEFDVSAHVWERIETKARPGARSGHRMVVWKHFIVLFGGFYDPGLVTRYLNDLWIFDMQEYKWKQIEFKEAERKPSPRSGFSFLPTADGIVLHGGYCKEYAKGKRPVGVMLEDTWFLSLSLTTPDATAPSSKKGPKSSFASTLATDTGKSRSTGETLKCKWFPRKKKSTSFAPSLRSGCTMALWAAKNLGVLFGGVTDEDTSEEALESVFHNDLYGYQLTDPGKWVSLALKRPKKKGSAGGAAKKKKAARAAAVAAEKEERRRKPGGQESDDEVDEDESDSDAETTVVVASPTISNTLSISVAQDDPDFDPDDPNHTLPIPRYNTMLAVLRNTLYIYGGIFEKGSKEYTLDDFYTLQLDKLERYICLKESGVIIHEGEESSSGDDEDDDEDSNDSDEEAASDDGTEGTTVVDEDEAIARLKVDKTIEEEEEELVEAVAEMTTNEKNELRSQANAFMGVSKDSTRTAEDIISTPLPGESLAAFYARSREYWSQKAFEGTSTQNRGKALRKDGFKLAEERYEVYKPVLAEVEKILAEAGLDEEEMKRGAATAGAGGLAGQSRNRR